jgi:hypothetical protein
MKTFIWLLLFAPSLLLADTFQQVPQVSRKSGGTLYQMTFPLQGSPMLVAFTASNHKVLLSYVQLVLSNGSLMNITSKFSSNSQGERFVDVDQTNSALITNTPAAGGIKIVAESFGGIGTLNLQIQATAANIGQNPNIPVQPFPPVHNGGSNNIICATVSNGFQPKNATTNMSIGQGSFTAASGCEKAVSSQRKGYICAVTNDGTVGVYDSRLNKVLGEYLPGDLDTCLEIVRNGTRDLICAQGQQANTAALLNIKTGQFIDENYRDKQSCFQSLQSLGPQKPGHLPPGNGHGPIFPPGPIMPPPVFNQNLFKDAYDWAYSSDGMNLTSTGAEAFAKTVTKRPDAALYFDTYKKAYAYSYSSDGMNLTSSGARAFAEQASQGRPFYVEHHREVYKWAYSSDGRNLTASGARQFADRFLEVPFFDQSWQCYKQQYQYGYSSSGLNKTASGAHSFALETCSLPLM